MVGFPSDVEQVYLADDGALLGAKSGAILCDMTTSDPSLAVRIHGKAKQRCVASIDAPVSGGDVGAREAKLAIMAGGDKQAFDAFFRCSRRWEKPLPSWAGRAPGSTPRWPTRSPSRGP